ncbi:MAG: DUF1553 domain-containing protein [Pirellulaceae bacterium]|nr:DUF1553 domain-containing protein [Pirellulaceae bacterium]
MVTYLKTLGPRLNHPVVMLCSVATVLGLFLVATGRPCLAQEQLSYNRDVRPILADKCFSCHGVDSAARQAGLRLDQREAAIEMQAIQPGDLEASQLIARIIADDPDALMPPPAMKKPLKAEEIEILKRWVQQGAQYEAHWSFIPPQQAALPEVRWSAWVKHPLDRFVLSKLESLGLEPAPQADALALFRRLHLDVTGLPPPPALVQQFVQEYDSEGEPAWNRWVDQLLESPSWGEHQARYWLDAARYGDTHGLHFDNYREMWPYRDWVIRAFNANQPFDQFTIEQLAGDLLPNPSRDQLIATGFQRCNITTNEGGTIAEENLANYAADRVQTLGWVYLGLTTNCCQCHDHKFDPVSMQDYYSMAAFFRNTTQGAFDGNVRDGKGPVIRVPSMEDAPRWAAIDAEIAAARQAFEAHKQAILPEFEQWRKSVSVDNFGQDEVEEGLIVHAPLLEGTGDQTLNLVGNQPLKATGPVTWIQDGKFGPAPVLKLGGNFEVGESGDFEHSQGFSVSAWIKPNSDKGTGSILARMDQAAEHRGWDVWVENGQVGMHIIDRWPEAALKVVTRNPVLKAGTWQHVLVTYDGSARPESIKVYIDGKRQPASAATNSLKPDSTVRTSTPLRIGQRSQNQALEGTAIQDVRIYDRQLLRSEIRKLTSAVPLAALLKLAATSGTGAQHTALMQYYLSNLDSQYPQLDQALKALESERTAIENRSPVTHVQEEKMNSQPMANILTRGEYDKVGQEVMASTPAALPPLPADAPRNRLGLAQWLVAPNHPLTARVTVNRFWQQLFGRGIVPTPEDFGVSGAMPSHPELLDWLAVDFQTNGWDVKRLFKQMFSSATYRQAAIVSPDKLERDPENVWLSRGPRFRMDAEMIRDYALASSGLLTAQMFGPPVKPYQPEGIWDVVGLPGGDTREYQPSQGPDLYRRSLYTFWKRMAPPPNLEIFNAPSREVCSVRRERTNTPLQALVTLNDIQFVEAARVLASRVLAQATTGDQTLDDNRALELIAQQTLCRPLSSGEQSIVLAGKDQLLAHFQANVDDARQLIAVGEYPVDSSADPGQLAAWTMVCNQMLNLDETLNK